jgi:uncharacterized protein
MPMNLNEYQWINEPEEFRVEKDRIVIVTEPETDFWQRTYYGFRNDNGHIFCFKTGEQDFTYSFSTRFVPVKLFDQCGVIVYQDQDNWFKGSIEFHTPSYSRLGSVVTNYGYSDWATTDIQPPHEIRMSYRLSRRGKDFLLENSEDGLIFKQMRIFHLHNLEDDIQLGIYACSPLESSFAAEFQNFQFGPCLWEPYHQ